MSAPAEEKVDLLDIENRVDEARHAAALCGLAVAGCAVMGTFDKDALMGLEALLMSQQESLAQIGRDIGEIRKTGISGAG